MAISSSPFAAKKFLDINGRRMACIDEGEGEAIVFQGFRSPGGEPAEVVRIVEDYSRWLASCDTPKLFVNAEPGSILVGRQRELCRRWPNQQEVTVEGSHFIQEDSPDEIGVAVAGFVRGLRSAAA